MAATITIIRREPDRSIISDVTIGGDDQISTTVTGAAGTVVDWVNRTLEAYTLDIPRTRGYQVVGLAVSLGPSGNIAVLQLCIGNQCLIYQLLHRDQPESPAEFLAFLRNPRLCYAGCDINVITDELERRFNFTVSHIMDLGIATKRADLRNAGLKELARELMNLEIEKPDEVRRRGWWWPELTNAQMAYACADAFVASRLGMLLAD